MDLVTIIIPAFNAETTVGRCLESIIAQSYKRLEILIIDDGSTDGTNELIRDYAERDSRIRLITQSNKGVSVARNTGLKSALGEYVLFVDADDYLEPNMIKKLYQVYRNNPKTDLVICGYDEIIKDKIHLPELKCDEELSRIQFLRNIFMLYSVKGFLFNKLFRMSIIKDNKLWLNEKIYICEDLLFCCEYGMHIQKAKYVSGTFYHYVVNEGSATRSEYSWKRFTAIYAFININEITRPLADKRLQKLIDAHYIVICIQIFIRVLRRDKNFSGREIKILFSIIRNMNMEFLFSDWPCKYKLVYLFMKCLNYRNIVVIA